MSELTVQQELFCLKYMECKRNASEAYRQSYNCEGSSVNTVCTDAYKLLHNPYIAHRIRQLFDEQAERLNVSIESLTEEYEEIRMLAKKSGDYAPAVSAITGKAKLHGLIVDKSQLAGKDGKDLPSGINVIVTQDTIKEQLKKLNEEF